MNDWPPYVAPLLMLGLGAVMLGLRVWVKVIFGHWIDRLIENKKR